MPPLQGRKATRGGKAGNSSQSRVTNHTNSSPPSKPRRPATAATAPLSADSIGKLIIGIDVGTTQCAVATAEILYNMKGVRAPKVTPRIKLYEGWVGFYMNHISTPRTEMYYEEDGTALTGNDLQPLFDNANPNTYRPDRLIRLWKLMFHHHQDEPIILDIQARIQKQLETLEKVPEDLVRDFARLLLNHLFIENCGINSLQQMYENFPKLDIELVVAVPPGRSTIAHEQVLQAFIQGPIRSTAVLLESEPAALFRNWVHEGEDDQNWIVGKRYLVADGGGGTACFVRFRLDSLKPLRFKQEFSSDSVVCGAEMVSDLFEKLIAEKVPMGVKNREWHIGRIRNKFDTQHKLYVGSHDRPLTFPKPWVQSEEDVITVSVAEIKDCFATSIRMLDAGIRQQLSLGEPVDYLVLGGGLFQNLYVRSSIKENFKKLTVLETSKHKGAVAKGAVLSKIYDNFISREEITRTKATVTLLEVTSEIKKSKIYKQLHIKKGDCDGRAYYWAATYLVKQGDKSEDGQESSTETSAKNARLRYVEEDDDMSFSEKILTFNYRPGKDTWAAYTREGTWINQRGKDIPQPEQVEMISWSPSPDDTEADLNDLDTGETADKKPYKILKYSVKLQAKETGTKYWAVLWSSEKMKKKTGLTVWSLSEPVERKALFNAQAISQSLADSFELDDNVQKALTTNELAIPQVANASTHEGPKSGSGPSQTNRTLSGLEPSTVYSEGQLSTVTNKQRPAITPSGKIARKEPRKADLPGIMNEPSTLNARVQQLPGKVLQGTLQSTQGGEVSEGSFRDNGGCWTCYLRHQSCSQEKPTCKKCNSYGLDCSYCQPKWWFDQDIRQQKLGKYKDQIKKYATTTKADEVAWPVASTPTKGSSQQRVQAGLSGRSSPSQKGSKSIVPSKSKLEIPNKRPRETTKDTTSGPQAKRPRGPVGLVPVRHSNSLSNGGRPNAGQRPAAIEDPDEPSEREIYRDGSFLVGYGSDTDDN